MKLTCLKKIKLLHKAYILDSATESGTITVISNKGNLTLLSSNFDIVGTLDLTDMTSQTSVLSLSIHSSGKLLSIVASGEVRVVTNEGKLVHSTEGDILYAKFSCDGKLFWYVRRVNNDELQVYVRDAKTLYTTSYLANVIVEDSYGESSPMLFHLPEENKIALWIAAGQDGQQMNWLTYEEGIINCCEMKDLENAFPPVFHVQGNCFLTSKIDETKIIKYSYPDLKKLAECELSGEQIDAIDSFYNDLICIDMDWNLYIFNMNTMELIAPLLVDGYEPYEEISSYYNNGELLTENIILTDITNIQQLGAQIVAVACHNKNMDNNVCQETLILLDLKFIF